MLANLAMAQEELRDLPAPAWVFGVVTLLVFLVALIGLLMFGKGRPHA